ncbi:MAG: hypothetical protein NUV51_13180 [Sulfuricaulis sp.]|nr:hypothetical protein [Sulfuricaulis sp.]
MRGYRVTRNNYPLGRYFLSHQHDTDKLDVAISKRIQLTLSDNSPILGTGDMLAVPRDFVYEAEVMGNQTLVSLDGIRND